MRRAARTDPNQAEIVAELRALGATVAILSAVGGGVPDLLVGWRGRDRLVEVKSPAGPRGGRSASGQKLNARQIRFREAWSGAPVIVATRVEDVVDELMAAEWQ